MMRQILRRIPRTLAIASALAALVVAQTQKATTPPAPATPPDPSGMYSFLQEGEFVQLSIGTATADANGKITAPVTGFVSRFGDLESDKGSFLDHFISKGTLSSSDISFTTKTVHGVWFEFKGKLERGAAKSRAEEGYFVLRGTLKRFMTDVNKKTTSQSRDAVFKSFPDIDAATNPSD
jgi:hypothetical protein